MRQERGGDGSCTNVDGPLVLAHSFWEVREIRVERKEERKEQVK